jgi:hypothetical protein
MESQITALSTALTCSWQFGCKMSSRTKKRQKVLFSQIVLNEILVIFVDFGDFTDIK